MYLTQSLRNKTKMWITPHPLYECVFMDVVDLVTNHFHFIEHVDHEPVKLRISSALSEISHPWCNFVSLFPNSLHYDPFYWLIQCWFHTFMVTIKFLQHIMIYNPEYILHTQQNENKHVCLGRLAHMYKCNPQRSDLSRQVEYNRLRLQRTTTQLLNIFFSDPPWHLTRRIE